MCRSVPTSRSIFSPRSVLCNIVFLLCKMPSHVEHLCNLKLYFNDVLIARHCGDFFWKERKKEYVHQCDQKLHTILVCKQKLERLRNKFDCHQTPKFCC